VHKQSSSIILSYTQSALGHFYDEVNSHENEDKRYRVILRATWRG